MNLKTWWGNGKFTEEEMETPNDRKLRVGYLLNANHLEVEDDSFDFCGPDNIDSLLLREGAGTSRDEEEV